MQSLNRFNRLLSTTMLTSALLAISPAFAQDVEQVPDAAQEAEDSGDQVVVTGSRLRRDAFNSPSPLTTLDVGENRQIGVTSITELLSRSTVANGTQVDQSLNTNAGNSNATEAPPAGGTGSSNINLRNLGAERTLVLLNGRRLAATGVRGAPAQPDIGLIPFSLVERAEIATEAGSSVYGADAVAGTVNVILKSDFEGFEVTGNVEVPEASGGTQYQVGFIAGAQSDRLSLVFGAEYFDRQRVSAGQRDFSSSFRDIEVDAAGNVFVAPFNGFFDNAVANAGETGFGAGFSDFACFQPGAPADAVAGLPANFIPCGALTPPAGFRNLGASNFGYFDFYNDSDERRNSDLVGDLERFSILATGEYDLGWFGGDNQLYFETFYFNRQNLAIGTNEQIFPTIPAFIPQEIACSSSNPLERCFATNGDGTLALVDNPLSPFDFNAEPIITLDDLPQVRDVELQQFRGVLGFKGDIGFGWFGANNWTFDTYATYDRGTGFQSQTILFEPNLIAAASPFINLSGELECSTLRPGTVNDGGFLTPQNCVVFDPFNASLFTGGPNGEGVFSTQAQRDFLLGTRTNSTTIEQYVYNGFVQGDLFKSPWGGVVTAGIGYEFRRDSIFSANSLDGVAGLNAAENAVPEGETIGRRNFHEVFGEVNIPLIVDAPGIKLLNIDGAVRYTQESNFGNDVTYRARVQYRPNDWLSISGGYGTSFRAPNLREQFLADQGGGVSGTIDPCIDLSIQGFLTAVGGDETDSDFRFLIDQCSADGVPFTDSNGNGLTDTTVTGQGAIVTIPTITGGNENLLPETSRTYTITGSFKQPWTDAFNFDVTVSYYDIRINNTVAEPSADQIVGQCYSNQDFPGLTSPFCSLLERDQLAAPASRILSVIDVTFFNIGEQTARGLDINTRFNTDLPFGFGDEPINWTFSTATAFQFEQEEQIFNADDRDDNLNEIGTPQFRLNIASNFSWGNWSLVSEHRRIGQQFEDITEGFRNNPFFDLSPRPATRDLDFVGAVWYHDASLTYGQDNYSVSIGVNNIADRAPPLIDDSEGPNRSNAVSSSGYDFFGRSYFITGRVNF